MLKDLILGPLRRMKEPAGPQRGRCSQRNHPGYSSYNQRQGGATRGSLHTLIDAIILDTRIQVCAVGINQQCQHISSGRQTVIDGMPVLSPVFATEYSTIRAGIQDA